MHYIIFGKFQNQAKPLNSNIKVFLWDKTSLVAMFAQKYLQHKTKTKLHTNDVFFLEKAKVYKLESNQLEENGDVIMVDPTIIQNFKYPEMEIHNTNLNTFCEKLNDSNIVIQLININ
jgi:hypothetical protein